MQSDVTIAFVGIVLLLALQSLFEVKVFIGT